VLSITPPLDELVVQAVPLMTRRDTNNLFLFGLFLQITILLILGSSPFSLLLLTTMETICYVLLIGYGREDINCGIIIAVGLTHLIIASFIKIILFQSLDDNLVAPFLAQSITLVYFLCITLAFFVARRLPIPRSRASPEPNLKSLELIILISVFLMMIPLLSGSSDNADAANGQTNFAGVATRGFPIVAMVTSIIRALKKSNCTRIIDGWSGAILGIAVIQGLASNSREGVFTPILVALIVPLYYGYRFNFRTIAIAAIAVGFVTAVISPALLLVRNERAFMSFPERIEKTIETAGLIIVRDPATIDAMQRPLDSLTYTVWGRYFGQPIPFSDRIGLIQTTDALAATAYGSSYVAIGDNLGDRIMSLFPNFVLGWFDLYIERTRTNADKVASSLGLTDPNAASFLAIPLDAEAYATGGFQSVILDSFLTYLLIFYAIRLVTKGAAAKGILPICLLLMSNHVCSEADAGAIFYYALRVLPQFIVTYYVVLWIARVLGSSQTPDTVPV
jgi:hypothetical protein